jgi:SHS2 domain-containing protein
LEEAFEQCAMAMFGYMTEIDTVEISESQDVEAEGHDMLSLLFHFLDECLFLFCADPFLIARVNIFLKFRTFKHNYFTN